MPNTYEAIATTTLGSNVGSVTFSSVPGTYTDIIAICSIKLSGGSTIYTQVNADNGTTYSSAGLNGEAGSVTASTNSSINSPLFGYSGNTTNFNNCIIQYMNYANTTTNKTIIGRGNSSDYVTARAALWRNTAAITEIKILGSFATGSQFSLYGIKAA